MQGSLLLQLLILLVVANGTAVGAKKLLGAALARPLDGGVLFVDGQPIFGPSTCYDISKRRSPWSAARPNRA